MIAEPESFQRLARRDAELRLDEIDAGDLLGDRMLDLDARVALDEKMFAALRADEELDRARIHVTRRAGQADRIFEDESPKLRIEIRRRRDLDHLLIAKLDRAVALIEMNDVAVRIGEDLDLDVARPCEQLLDKHRAVAECRERLALATREGRRHLIGARDGAHPATAASRRGFQHDRVAELFRDRDRIFGVRQRMWAAGDNRNAERARQFARLGLVAEQRQRFRPRPDEGETLLEASLREAGILGQEAIAGMHAIAARGLGGLDAAHRHRDRRAPDRSTAAPRGRARATAVVTRVWSESASAGANTLTDSTPSADAARATRMAISPRLAINTRLNKGQFSKCCGLRPSSAIDEYP